VDPIQLSIRLPGETLITVNPLGGEGSSAGVIVTLATALVLGSAWDTAVTVTTADEGMLAGAAYRPLADMVPVLALPPAVPFTCQVTLVLLAFATVAANVLLDPTGTLADVGVTDTATAAGVILLPPPPPPQATSATDSNNAARLR
jgi:hypothetical protein